MDEKSILKRLRNRDEKAFEEIIDLYSAYVTAIVRNLLSSKGTREDANRFVDNLKLFSLLANVADVKSLVINPAGTTHSQMTDKELEACGIAPTTIRLSIGTEHIDDIISLMSEHEAHIQEEIRKMQTDLLHIQQKVRFYHGIKEAIHSDKEWPCWNDYSRES